MKMDKGIKIATVFGILSFLVLLGYYLFSHWVHVPQWITFPYDVSIYRGEAVINEYLSEERQISIPEKIMGMKVCNVDKDPYNEIGTDAVIVDIPQGIGAGKIYHQESQSYYWLIGDEAGMLEYVGNEKEYEVQEEVWGRKVTEISRKCFKDSNIENVTIPATVADIGARAFEGCTNLKQVILPSNLDQIGAGAFAECKNLKQIILPPNLEQIKFGVFQESGIQHIELPENIKEIECCAFEDSAVNNISGLENVE